MPTPTPAWLRSDAVADAAPVVPRDFVDVSNVRVALEGLAIALCARRRVSTATLELAVEEMRPSARAGDLVRLSDRDAAFHLELCALSGSAFIASAFRPVAEVLRVALAVEYDDPRAVPDAHLPLIAAIASGDEAAARSAFVEHVGLIRSLRGLVSRGGVRS